MAAGRIQALPVVAVVAMTQDLPEEEEEEEEEEAIQARRDLAIPACRSSP